ncbi:MULTISPECIES: phosphatidate cytidylyltransferase [Paenibacillus]|jgi:phosphatidate cytidylyltransferase|uniref:Phosphatidate cytidylyltransferase n=1 Tax=Paenibacillus peoriae TaxID=59893 RepID=A0A7H0Y8S6_9BACL|nr:MULTISPECIES: phosphatidate cytidylyltransferase [Paenibacillus]KAF6634468.1 phosphatidate cytidylyltransferase [Paenibacillus sp. EKM208P]QNR67484.1 phosphatidate cytidylyltransferase [Paenibacillus peoriae]QYK70105.1 Cytidylyltransferase family protein [Paenibacillus sp. S02]UMY54816.1 phosphatidate cytidylyltransferase [Paenibacillus peoriae]
MDSSLFTLILIFTALLVIHLIYIVVVKTQPDKDYAAIGLRIKTWWGMFFIFCLATLFNPIVSLLSLMALTFFALKEYFSMIRSRKADRRLFLWAYLAIPVQFYWIYIGWYGMFIVFIPIYVFLLLPLPRLINKGTVGFLRSVSSTQWGLMLMVFGLSHLAYFQFATPQYGAKLVLFLVVLTQLNDVVHYLASLYFGKRKIVPTSNPNITWEGFALAFPVTIAASYFIYPYLTPFDLKFGIIFGMLISLSGFFGSLTVSVLKRDLLIGDDDKFDALKKSYLSRVDSLTYTSPVFFHVIRYFFDFM